MKKTFNASLIGCGRMGCFTSEIVKKTAPDIWFPLSHADAIKRHAGLNLVALADKNKINLERSAKYFNVEKKYINYENLIIDTQTELLSIATRSNIRKEIIILALENGIKAFHIEKPLCQKLEDLLKLEKKFSNKNLFFTYGTIRRYFDIYNQARKLAHSGKFGRLREIKANFGFNNLMWSHPHTLDLLIFGSNESDIVQIQAKLTNVKYGKNKNEILNDPKILYANVYFKNGIMGSITQSDGCDLSFVCDNAEIIVRSDGEYIDIYRRQGNNPYMTYRKLKKRFIKNSYTLGTLAPMSMLYDCLSNKKKSIKKNEIIKNSIINSQKALFAIVQSHKEESKLVSFNDLDSRLIIKGKTGTLYP